MKIILFFFLLINFLSFSVNGQSNDSLTIKRYYEQNTILWTGKYKYYKGELSIPLKNLKTEYSFSKEAMMEYSLYKRNKRNFILTYTISLVGVISSLAISNQKVSLGVLSGSLAGIGLSINFSNKSFQHLQRSIWVHNRDVMLK